MDGGEPFSPGTPYSPASPLRDGGGDAGSPRGTGEGFDANNFAVVIRGAAAQRGRRRRWRRAARSDSALARGCAAAQPPPLPPPPLPPVRPPLPREQPFTPAVLVRDERTITISENLAALDDAGGAMAYSTHTLNFDYVYDESSTQRIVYETTAKAVVDSSLKGYNATIFAYGQTGTGKTYTMEGFNSADERGIIPRSIEQIFRHIQTSVSPRMRFLVRASYLQIYNEVISDLLKPQRTNLLIREDKKRGVFVEGLSEWVVRSPAEIYGLMERGGAMRATGSTKMNELSSRSHAVFIIIAEQVRRGPPRRGAYVHARTRGRRHNPSPPPPLPPERDYVLRRLGQRDVRRGLSPPRQVARARRRGAQGARGEHEAVF